MSDGFLVDTSILSALAPGKAAPAPALSDWLREHSDRLHLSAVTIAEVEQGVCKLRRAGGSQRAALIAAWLDRVMTEWSDRIVPLDAQVARLAGALSDEATAAGRHPGMADVFIAATAKSRQMLLVTANGRHFAALGVAWTDPSSAQQD